MPSGVVLKIGRCHGALFIRFMHRLLEDELISERNLPSKSNRPRRVYNITHAEALGFELAV